MRKIKILLMMSLCVFLFSGCGGSASSDSSSSSSTLHSQLSSVLTGDWIIDNASTVSSYVGTGTINPSATSVTLSSDTSFRISFSGIEFASSSDESAGNIDVFYSHVATLVDSAGTSKGTLSIKSYSQST